MKNYLSGLITIFLFSFGLVGCSRQPQTQVQLLFDKETMTLTAGQWGGKSIMINVDGKSSNLVKGSFIESGGHDINFFVFDQKNYNAWKDDNPTTPYVSMKRSGGSEFSFVPDHTDIYYFVFDNTYSILVPKVPVLSATWSWQ